MSEKPISPLRPTHARRHEHAPVRATIRNASISVAVKKLASFLGRSPDSATPEELARVPAASDRDQVCNHRASTRP